jgi:tetratricopeptide (TPR) repeat protein
VKYLEPAGKSDPANAELHEVLAQSCLWAKKYSCAQEEFRQIVLLQPNSAAEHMLTGEALDGLQRTPEAIVEFQRAAKVSPEEPNVHFGLGYLYWKSHQYDEAKIQFEKVLSLDPNHPQALVYLGDIAMKKTNLDEALTLLRKAVGEKNDIRLAYIDLGAILTEQKQYPAALAALRRAVELDPGQPDAHYRLGRAYQALGKTAESQKEFAKVRELHQKADEPLAAKISTSPLPLPQ